MSDKIAIVGSTFAGNIILCYNDFIEGFCEISSDKRKIFSVIHIKETEDKLYKIPNAIYINDYLFDVKFKRPRNYIFGNAKIGKLEIINVNPENDSFFIYNECLYIKNFDDLDENREISLYVVPDYYKQKRIELYPGTEYIFFDCFGQYNKHIEEIDLKNGFPDFDYDMYVRHLQDLNHLKRIKYKNHMMTKVKNNWIVS